MRQCWNRQTGTFEGRVSSTYGFKSHLPHQTKKDTIRYPFLFGTDKLRRAENSKGFSRFAATKEKIKRNNRRKTVQTVPFAAPLVKSGFERYSSPDIFYTATSTATSVPKKGYHQVSFFVFIKQVKHEISLQLHSTQNYQIPILLLPYVEKTN